MQAVFISNCFEYLESLYKLCKQFLFKQMTILHFMKLWCSLKNISFVQIHKIEHAIRERARTGKKKEKEKVKILKPMTVSEEAKSKQGDSVF